LNFPEISTDSIPLCKPSDLETSSNYNEVQGKVLLGITLINKSKSPCTLANPPQVSLLDKERKSLGITSIKSTFVQTPVAPRLVTIAPDESEIVSLIWQNYCQPPSGDDFIIQFVFAQNQTLDVTMKVLASPGCTAKDEPSTVTISPYSVPP